MRNYGENMKNNALCFIGHRNVFDRTLEQRLYEAVEAEIKNGYTTFYVGNHGDFDKMVHGVCAKLKNIHKDMTINIVITSLAQLNQYLDDGGKLYSFYKCFEFVSFDIETTHFKQKITKSNQQMIDACSKLICYVNPSYKYSSGAMTAYKYANKKGLQIINLYKKYERLPEPK